MPSCSRRGAPQSTGTPRVAHWKPSPQSFHASVDANAGSGGHVVVVVVVDVVVVLAVVLVVVLAAAGSTSASDETIARTTRAARLTARRDRPRGSAGRACRG